MTTLPIPGPVQTVLDLFAADLADVRFGDVDTRTLARVAAEVDAAATVVAAAQASLDVARVTLHERQEVLLQHAARALAYARVYAESNEALSARLEGITLPRPVRRARADVLVLSSDPPAAPARPRGRPRKAPIAEAAPSVQEGLLSTAD